MQPLVVGEITGNATHPAHQYASKKTIASRQWLGGEAMGMFPLAVIQIYELNYLLAISKRTSFDPRTVVESGAGTRVPEIWAMMAYPRMPLTWQSRRTPLFGKLPAKLHSAEPHPTLSATVMVDDFADLIPPYTAKATGRLSTKPQPELLLTDDSHQSLLSLYPPRSIDRLIVLRIDPESLVRRGRFTIQSNPDYNRHLHESVQTLAKPLNLVKPGGDAILTVGSGNLLEETLVRQRVQTTLRSCLGGFGIPYTEAYNPVAQLLAAHLRSTGEYQTALELLNPLAAFQALVIPYSPKLRNLQAAIGEDEAEGEGTTWFKTRALEAHKFVDDHLFLGMGEE